MSLHVLAGIYKGRPLKTPKGPLARPTTALLRKAVFDICQSKIENARFLDLFACSGAMGIEALSRGASHATFVEKDRSSLRILEENISLLNLQSQASFFCQDVFAFLSSPPPFTFDLIYLDPPYALTSCEKLLLLLDKSPLLSPDALVFLEESSPGSFAPASLALERLQHKNTRRSGAAVLHQFFLK
ncbi:MAG: 16S rRNA (guanine(966)-N(2))-methyltransferase RsmD [Chlamydiae bacterium]|nr:16S rRNA (guanine(966)-N(2))-methyltransferase RsmD [Chlamydiota bacterium]